jgi:hypothetical protein
MVGSTWEVEYQWLVIVAVAACALRWAVYALQKTAPCFPVSHKGTRTMPTVALGIATTSAGAAQNSRYASMGLIVRPSAGIFLKNPAKILEKLHVGTPVLDRTIQFDCRI